MKETKIASILKKTDITDMVVVPAGSVPLCKGVNALPKYIEEELGMDPHDEHTVFVFMNAALTTAKLYMYDNGKPLICTQYWKGCKIVDWPTTWEDTRNFTFEQYTNVLSASYEDLVK